MDKLIRLYDKKSINILDIGTGGGCILITCLVAQKLKRDWDRYIK